jgi:hypothetical protein
MFSIQETNEIHSISIIYFDLFGEFIHLIVRKIKDDLRIMIKIEKPPDEILCRIETRRGSY